MANLELPPGNNLTRLRWAAGWTANMRNFESLRVDFALEDDARPGELVKEASDRIWAFVEEELISKLTEVKAQIERL